jgi:hypothetical protein
VKKGSLIAAILALYACLSYGSDTKAPGQEIGSSLITVKAASATELSRLVSQQTGASFVYVSADPRGLAAEFRELPLAQVVEILSRTGAVAFSSEIPQTNSSPEALLAARLNVSARAADGRMLAELLAKVSGDRIVFQPRNGQEQVALDLKEVPIRDLPRVLGRYGQVSFAGAR